ncbi:MAG TPA: amidohydrolase family protein [Candidatus Paceibacterota bacterium]|nr:amidohydrolase family protein [Candidatus Paceibacterota bacterium]
MTLLIKNVQVFDSSGKAPVKSDIFISGDKISAIGDFSSRGANETIDGQEAYASPGFIDVNTDSDHYLTLFEDPAQEDFLKQGVTSIIGGQCGSSLAPLIYGSLESIRKWTDIDKMNVDWNSVAEYLKILESRKLGVNFGTMIGHSTIRRSIVGESQRALTKNEMKVFSETLKRSLSEGGFGLSTGLGYIHSKNTPYAEIKTLLKTVKDAGGVYATHLRKSGEELGESIDETIKISQETGVKTLISHFLPHFGEEGEYEKSLEKFSSLPPGRDFHFDIYPFDSTIVPLYTLLPEWAQRENLEMMNTLIQDEWQRSKIMKELPSIQSDGLTVSKAAKNEAVVGQSMADLKSMYGTNDSKKALLQLMITTKLRAVVFYKNINEKLIKKAITNKHSLISSNAASSLDKGFEKSIKSERATSTFTKFLALAEKENLMSLGEAIRKITAVPAKKFGIKGRGELKQGNFADIAIFKNGEIRFVIINGKIAVKNGIFQNISFGKILRHENI